MIIVSDNVGVFEVNDSVSAMGLETAIAIGVTALVAGEYNFVVLVARLLAAALAVGGFAENGLLVDGRLLLVGGSRA